MKGVRSILKKIRKDKLWDRVIQIKGSSEEEDALYLAIQLATTFSSLRI